MQMLKELMLRYKWMLLLSSILSVASASAGIGVIAIITEVVTNMQDGDRSLKYPFYLFALVVFAVMALSMLSGYILLRFSSTVVYEVQVTLLKRIFSTKYEKIERAGSHRIIAVMEHDVDALSQGILMVPKFIYNLATVVLCFCYMVYSSWQLTFFVCVVIGLIIMVANRVINIAFVHQTVLREYTDKFFKNMQAFENGGKELFLNASRRRFFFTELMVKLFSGMRERSVKSAFLFISLDSLTTTMVFFLIGAMLYGSSLLLPGLDMGVLLAFVLLILYLTDPISELMGSIDEINEIRVSLKKIDSLQLEDASQFRLPTRNDLEKTMPWERLVFDSVAYEYAPKIDPNEDFDSQISESEVLEAQKNSKAADLDEFKFAFGPVSAEFRRGEVTIVKGGNGSGKSTFAKILSGLYSSTQGGIYLDDREIGKDVSDELYRNFISAVFTDFHIFNVVLGKDGDIAKDEDVIPEIEVLNLVDKISCVDGKLSTTELSSGQRKRLVLLQSFLEDKSICVFDEWAAEQDPSFKKYFYEVLLGRLKRQNKVVIVISHDDKYYHVADNIIKFEEGIIV